ncbi:hypothetical protein F4811DRAFT_538543, partial [Daldinia bambusicola]
MLTIELSGNFLFFYFLSSFLSMSTIFTAARWRSALSDCIVSTFVFHLQLKTVWPFKAPNLLPRTLYLTIISSRKEKKKYSSSSSSPSPFASALWIYKLSDQNFAVC